MSASLVWLGFLPVLGYLLLEAPAGHRKALWAALVLATGEFLAGPLTGAGSLDLTSAGAFAVLCALVALSLRTGDPFYFKIHGPVINVLAALALLVAWYGFDKALLLDLAARDAGLDKLAAANPSIKPEAVSEMLRLLSQQLPWWLVLHALLTVYAAANWGKWAWAFLRVPGFFIMLFMASNFAGAAAFAGAAKP